MRRRGYRSPGGVEPMRFAGPGEAKQFFVDKIVAEATAQALPLSAAERYMLAWSESDPHFVQDRALTAAFEAETSGAEFEGKVSRLARDAYTRDVRSDSAGRESWRQAYAVLKKGDHYLLVMLERALGWRLRRLLIF